MLKTSAPPHSFPTWSISSIFGRDKFSHQTHLEQFAKAVQGVVVALGPPCLLFICPIPLAITPAV
jgi:hypothetical protein